VEGDPSRGRGSVRRALARWLGFAYTRPFHLLAVAALIWAVSITWTGWTDYWVAIDRQFSWTFVLINLLISAIVVRSTRALIHGATCKRHHQFVTEVGIALTLYLVPSFYVDWSDVVYLRNKKERDWVILAGLYYHLLLWAVAMIAWRLTAAGGMPNIAFLMVSFVAGFTFLAIAVNPIAEGDGYFLLVNWLEIENLRERSLASLGSWIQLRLPTEVLSPRERRLFRSTACSASSTRWSSPAGSDGSCGAGSPPSTGDRGARRPPVRGVVAHKPMVESIARRRSVKWLFRKDGDALRWSVRSASSPPSCSSASSRTLRDRRTVHAPAGAATEVHTQVEGEGRQGDDPRATW
jgi:hypothetical protein